MRAIEIRDLDNHALLDKIEAVREELFKLKLNWYTNKLDNPNQIRMLRKDLARLLTIAHERHLAAEYVALEDARGVGKQINQPQAAASDVVLVPDENATDDQAEQSEESTENA